ncbi:MAG: chromate resistance protein ChrB domain-containing protein, partial [Pseudomonadota bacterium]
REFIGKDIIIACYQGLKLSQGLAAILRHHNVRAQVLEGGFVSWYQADLPLVSLQHMPTRNANAQTVWVTHARPKIDRIACPWLIRRFIDPSAMILFVGKTQVQNVAERFNATPFDDVGGFWSHKGALCSFDKFLENFALVWSPLQTLGEIVRAADTNTLENNPQAAGLLAISLGYSRMIRDDLQQMHAMFSVYDALYRWCKDARDETHDWPQPDQVS